MKKQAKKNKKSDEEIDLDNPEFKKAWELLNYTRQSVFLTGKAGTGVSRKSVGISIKVCNTEKEEFLIHNTSEICTKEFYFSIERFGQGI